MKSTYTETYKVLLSRLIRYRKEQSLSQAELAKKLGRPQSFISKIENGERRLDVIEFLELAKAIGIKPEDIIRKLL